MNAASPKVAVLVAGCNGQDALDASIRELPVDEPLHILIVDDASTPPLQVPACDPLHVVEMVRNKVSRTAHGALRRGVAMAAARGFAYVARLDAGDVALAGRFRLQREFLDGHPEVAVVGAACRRGDDGRGGSRVRPRHFPPDDARIRCSMLFSERLCPGAVMMRVGAVIAVGNYRTTYPGAEDQDLFLRLMNRSQAANLQEVLIQKGTDGGRTAAQRRQRMASVIRLQLGHLRAAWRPAGAGLRSLQSLARLKLRFRQPCEADGGALR